jgi:hypothetical protein
LSQAQAPWQLHSGASLAAPFLPFASLPPLLPRPHVPKISGPNRAAEVSRADIAQPSDARGTGAIMLAADLAGRTALRCAMKVACPSTNSSVDLVQTAAAATSVVAMAAAIAAMSSVTKDEAAAAMFLGAGASLLAESKKRRRQPPPSASALGPNDNEAN